MKTMLSPRTADAAPGSRPTRMFGHWPALAVGVIPIAVMIAAGPATAQQNALLDVVPENVAFGLSISRLSEIGPKLDEISEQIMPGYRVSRYLPELYYSGAGVEEASIESIFNRGSTGAVVFTKGQDAQYFDLYQRAVFVFPVTDVKPLAEHRGLNVDALNAGQRVSDGDRWFQLDGDRLLASQNEYAIEQFSQAQPIRQRLNEQQRETFSNADLFVLLGAKHAEGFWSEVLGPLTGPLAMFEQAANLDADTRKLADDLLAAADEMESGLVGIGLDGGVSVRLTTLFDQVENGVAGPLIESIRGGDGASNLDHLPSGNFIAGMAARGTGQQNVVTAKATVRMIVQRFSPGQEILSDEDKPIFYEMFGRLWQNLNGTRLAAYRNPDSMEGEITVIGIFNTKNPRGVLSQVPEIVDFVNQGIERLYGADAQIQFVYKPSHRELLGEGNYRMDLLQIQSERLAEQDQRLLEQLLGSQKGKIYFLPLDQHIVMLMGNDEDLLRQAINNVQSAARGLSAHPALAASSRKLDPRKKIELHVSAMNLDPIYSATLRPRKRLKPYQPLTNVTSAAMVFERDRLGVDVWIPLSEIDRLMKIIF